VCDRTREEVLARNLAFEYFRGKGLKDDELYKRIDNAWITFLVTADKILDVLEEHKRAKDF